MPRFNENVQFKLRAKSCGELLFLRNIFLGALLEKSAKITRPHGALHG